MSSRILMFFSYIRFLKKIEHKNKKSFIFPVHFVYFSKFSITQVTISIARISLLINGKYDGEIK